MAIKKGVAEDPKLNKLNNLLKDGHSQEVIAAIGPSLPDPNSSRVIDVERLYFSLEKSKKIGD